MEGEHRYGDVEPQEVEVGKEPGRVDDVDRTTRHGQVDEPESEDESREKPLTEPYGQPRRPDRAEKVPEPPVWFLRETAEEPGAAATAPAAAEENAGEEVTSPSLVDEPPAPEAASEALSRDGEGEVESPVIEPVRDAVAAMEAEAEHEESKPSVKSVKGKRGRQKKTAHKRTDKAHKKSAKRKSRKASAKRPGRVHAVDRTTRPAKKPKKSRA